MSSRFCYVYTYTSDNADWRIYEGIVLKTHTTSQSEHVATIMLSTSNCGEICVKDVQHVNHRTSAEYFVYQHEWSVMCDMVDRDWVVRGVWLDAWKYAQNIREYMEGMREE